MLFRKFNKIPSIRKLLSDVAELFENILSFFDLPHRLEYMRRPHFVFIRELLQVVRVIFPTLFIEWGGESFKDIPPECLHLQV